MFGIACERGFVVKYDLVARPIVHHGMGFQNSRNRAIGRIHLIVIPQFAHRRPSGGSWDERIKGHRLSGTGPAGHDDQAALSREFEDAVGRQRAGGHRDRRRTAPKRQQGSRADPLHTVDRVGLRGL